MSILILAMHKERLLITGGTGSLGTALIDHCQANEIPFVAPTHAELDITRHDDATNFVKGRNVRGIIHSAAIVDWTQAHEQPKRALAVNCSGTINMCRLAKEIGVPLLYVSTDAVFPGATKEDGYTEKDIPGTPVSFYGMTKLMGEWACTLHYSQTTIVRLGWLFGSAPAQDQKFVGLILKQMAAGKKDIKAVNDKFGSPTYAPHAASKLVELVRQPTYGIRHVINSGVTTRYNVATEVVSLWGNPQTRVEPVSSDFFPAAVKRPDYAGLSTLYDDVRLPAWQEALAEYHARFPALSDFASIT